MKTRIIAGLVCAKASTIPIKIPPKTAPGMGKPNKKEIVSPMICNSKKTAIQANIMNLKSFLE